MELNKQTPKDTQSYSHDEFIEEDDYLEDENFDQMEEVPDNDDMMEIDEDDEHEPFNSDADTFNTSSHQPLHLNHLEFQYLFHGDAVLSIATNPLNKNEFVSGSMDDQIAVWNIEEEAPLFATKFNESVNNVAVSFDGSHIACSILDNQIKVLSKTEDGKFEDKLTLTGFDDEISVM